MRREIKTTYQADDGSVFGSKAECEAYENPEPVREMRVILGPALSSDELLLRHTPEARLRRMFDELSVKVCNATHTANDIARFMNEHRVDRRSDARKMADELARWQLTLKVVRVQISRVNEKTLDKE